MGYEESKENGYRPSDDGILLYDWIDAKIIGEKGKEACIALAKVVMRRPKNILQELNIYRKYVPDVFKWIEGYNKALQDANRETKRFYSNVSEKSHKRWTPEEDELLIEQICNGEMSINEISNVFGRTPQSISSRVTVLVGRKRLSQEVAGKFIGTINGEQREAELVGTLYK